MPTFKKIKYNGAECATAHADHASVADTAANAGHQTTADSATTATSATTAGTAASASEAAKLSTARTIQTDLASGAAASFDGSGNVTPGVTGVLPIANGGTGSNVQNFVGTSGDQNIEGNKSFRHLFLTGYMNGTVGKGEFRAYDFDNNGYTLMIAYQVNGNNGSLQVSIQGTTANLVLGKQINGVYTETAVATL